MLDCLLAVVGLVRKSRCDYTHARDMEYIRERDAEVERLRLGLADFIDSVRAFATEAEYTIAESAEEEFAEALEAAEGLIPAEAQNNPSGGTA